VIPALDKSVLKRQLNLSPVPIAPDNEVRIIDLFADSLSIKDYGFRRTKSGWDRELLALTH